MTAKAIMFMGTGSDVGKSLIVAGLCRVLANRGIKVAPFKPQNMSNNAAATPEGGEIGRAQALQAKAAKIPPSVHMNPILLKPESERGAQIIVQGKRHATLQARDFFRVRSQFMKPALESFHHLAAQQEFILVEGAGSPAETNLRQGDLANMGFASAANLPVTLIGDIHRGGVIASLVGTHLVLDATDRGRIKSFIINNFHGDPDLFSEGKKEIERRTGWRCHGVVPHFASAALLPAEDALALEHTLTTNRGPNKIGVFRLPRIANFDDLDPLRLEPDVSVVFVQPGTALPGDCALVILPGSKSTMADLADFRAQGWDLDLKAHVRRQGRVLGLCGGYQMLGKTIHDPLGLEGGPSSMEGLGYLDVETTLIAEKTSRPTNAIHRTSGAAINAYEIHLGQTSGPDCTRPFATLENGLTDGATTNDGLIEGTYLHGCFVNDSFRSAFLKSLCGGKSQLAYDQQIEVVLDELARHLEQHMDIEALLSCAEIVR